MFSFLKYTSPIWYYRLYGRAERKLYSQAFLKDSVDGGIIVPDLSYNSKAAHDADLVYQSLNKGLIDPAGHTGAGAGSGEVSDPEDNYRFVRKYFGTKWVWYSFAIRCLSGNNPLREVYALFSARDSKRMNYTMPPQEIHAASNTSVIHAEWTAM